MNRKRTAVTLIEVTMTLTILSVVWLAITTTIYTLHRADHRVRDALQAERSVDQFAMRLRSDAHSAIDVTLRTNEDDSEQLRLSVSANREVHYRFTDGLIQRTIIEANKSIGHDSFATNCVGVQWELVEFDTSALVVARLRSRDKKTDASRRREVKAALPRTSRSGSREEEASS